MCGISGILSKNMLGSDAIVASLKSIQHRGPDNCLYTNGHRYFSTGLSNMETRLEHPSSSGESLSSKLWLGFNRLSIVDMSNKGMQPFFDKETGTYFLLNGEIYNYLKLKKDYLDGESFFSDADSEVAFKLYLKLGDDFIDKLEGMFAICVYSMKTETLKIWRDRFGIKPMYYYEDEKNFVFSSEIKGIFESGLVEKKPNYTGIGYSMYLGACPSPLTIYDKIFSVRPAHRFEYSLKESKSSSRPYWRLEYQPTNQTISGDEFQRDVENLCQLYNSKSQAKAVMLSGGLDSGQLAYSFGKVDETIKGLTVYQPGSKYNELDQATLNADNASLELETIQVPSSFSKEKILEYQTAEEEPNVVPEPTLILSKVASQSNIRVLYNGLGPDEIFGGYEYYQKMEKWSKYFSIINFIPTGLFPSSKRHKLLELKEFGLATFPLISRQVFSWKEVKNYLETNNVTLPEHPIRFLLKQVKETYPNYNKLPTLKKASYLDLYYYVSSYHTLRSDLPSMLSSVELRFPFLNHNFVQKYFNQSDTFDNLESSLKPRMRDYVKDVLPLAILDQPKKGFGLTTNIGNESSAQKKYYLEGLTLLFSDKV